jgi:GTP:adenosylcobinamide-phosphate guanylyltransferase
MANNKKATALILAASRRGPEDAVAKIQNISHKCLVVIDGMVMLERVVREIRDAKDIGDIYVSIENRELLESVPALKAMLDKGEIHYTPSADNLFLSVKAAIEDIQDPWPLVISTGDNALHTSDMIDHFTSDILSKPLDAAIAMTPASVILKAYPDGKRAFHELKDGGWSSCNLYALTTPASLKAAKVFEGGGQFGKQPKRILKAFGLMFMLLYKFKLASSTQLTNILSRRWGLNIKLVSMPYADAPIDVDNPGDFERTESILKSRRTS